MAELAGSDFQNLRVLLGHPWANELMGLGEGWSKRLVGRLSVQAKVTAERVDVRSIRLGAEFDEVEVMTEAGELRWVAVPESAPVPPVLRGFLLGVAAERSAGLRAAGRRACTCVRVPGVDGGLNLVPGEVPCPVHERGPRG